MLVPIYFFSAQDLLKVRLTEETLAERYKQQEMRAAILGSGQEAVAVGVCHASNGRCRHPSSSHNHFLAKGGSTYDWPRTIWPR